VLCGKCWAVAREALATGKPAEGCCPGGLVVHAVPAVARGLVAGALAVVVSGPPRDRTRQWAVARRFRLPLGLVRAAADS
jgi:hypothetical protein